MAFVVFATVPTHQGTVRYRSAKLSSHSCNFVSMHAWSRVAPRQVKSTSDAALLPTCFQDGYLKLSSSCSTKTPTLRSLPSPEMLARAWTPLVSEKKPLMRCSSISKQELTWVQDHGGPSNVTLAVIDHGWVSEGTLLGLRCWRALGPSVSRSCMAPVTGIKAGRWE